MSRHYKNSPIIEALCEFQFEPDSSWDIAIPGIMSERLKDTFPVRRQNKQAAFNIVINSEPLITTTDRMVLFRKDEKAFLQLAPNLLAINHLKPYPSWDAFLPLIELGFRSYLDIAAPKGIHRIGLRYINRIQFPTSRVE